MKNKSLANGPSTSAQVGMVFVPGYGMQPANSPLAGVYNEINEISSTARQSCPPGSMGGSTPGASKDWNLSGR